MKTEKKSFFKKISDWFKSPSCDTFLFIVFLILLNLVAGKLFFRIDLTSSRNYSLSSSSRLLVKTIDEPLSIKVFFSSNIPSQYSAVKTYVEDILTEYDNAGNSNFSIEYYDPAEPEDEKLAFSYGLKQIQLQELKSNEVGLKQVFMGLVVTYADQIEKLDQITSPYGLEYKITSTISRVISNANILTGLQDKIHMTLYKTEEISNFNIGNFKQIDSVVSSAYSELAKKYGDKIDFNTVSPLNEEALTLGERYGIQVVSLKNDDGTTFQGALGLVLECGDKVSLIPLRIQNAIFSYVVAGLDGLNENLEEGIKALVSKTSSVGYVIGHGELDTNSEEKGCAAFTSLLDDTYTLKGLDLKNDEIPVGMQCIIINGPRTPFEEDELYKIDQFIMRGGNVMFFVDSYDEQLSRQGGYEMPQYIPVNTGLEKLLSKYGVELKSGYVLDRDCHTQNNQQYGKLNFYYVPVIQNENLAKHNPITSNLGYVYYLKASPLDSSKALESPSRKVTKLVQSSKNAWLLDGQIILSPIYNQLPDESEYSQFELATLVEGKFESPYETSLASENDGNISASQHLTKSIQSGKIFVTGTSSITSGELITKDSTESPVAIFLRNAVDYMNGNADLALMRTKGISLNTLRIQSGSLASMIQAFNIIVVPLLIAFAWLCVMIKRRNYAKKIRMEYNPDDSREVK